MQILVTGGAGYIGSFMTKSLLDGGNQVVVLDSLERGDTHVVDTRAKLVVGDLLDKQMVRDVLSSQRFDGVIHFAGFISMGESMENPDLYFQKNTVSSLNLIEAMVQTKTNNLIFSSTAGVYGNPEQIPIMEDSPKQPQNPYGESKLMVEHMLSWFGKIHRFSYACLRYFNACGAALDGKMGENHHPETHLLPSIMKAILTNKPFTLYGNDYHTMDGTCVRDYIHVLDLVQAHTLALQKLSTDAGAYTYNVGTGKGYSNKQVMQMIEKITGKTIAVVNGSRRPGDADELVADVSRIQKELGFQTKYSDLETIVKTAWEWHRQN